MLKKLLWFFLLLFLFLILALDRLIGFALESKLEKTLTDLFGMPVTIEGLRADPVSGRVSARRVTFMNQPEFLPGPHLDVKGIRFCIDFRGLLFDKRVDIKMIDLEQPFYFIDRIATPEGPTNNVITWYHHIKDSPEEDEPDTSAAAPDSKPAEKHWRVILRRINIHQGTFVFQDRSSEESEKKYVFEKLDGYLAGFEWPSPNISLLSQEVKVYGTFGQFYPAPIEVHGRANFATSQVSFDLEGNIKEGLLLEHRRFWEGSSIRILDGRFQLKSRTLCIKRELQSHNELVLKSLKVAPGPSATDKIWGLPVAGAIGFLENEKVINLKVNVHGDITDPQFEFHRAFRAAFQDSLASRTKNGIGLLTAAPTKLAVQTKDIVQETPARLVNGLEKIVKKTQVNSG